MKQKTEDNYGNGKYGTKSQYVPAAGFKDNYYLELKRVYLI